MGMRRRPVSGGTCPRREPDRKRRQMASSEEFSHWSNLRRYFPCYNSGGKIYCLLNRRLGAVKGSAAPSTFFAPDASRHCKGVCVVRVGYLPGDDGGVIASQMVSLLGTFVSIDFGRDFSAENGPLWEAKAALSCFMASVGVLTMVKRALPWIALSKRSRTWWSMASGI